MNDSVPGEENVVPQDDSWSVVTQVGWTALMVAAGRAVETGRADGLIDDPYAELFVGEADTSVPLPTRPGQLWPDLERLGDAPSPVDAVWDLMASYLGVRSHFFDSALLGAPPDQIVVLAAGLDARAFRLAWPAGTTLYELDRESVIAFKDRVVDGAGGSPRCTRRVVPVDLRDEWTQGLLAAGFDPSRPSTFLAEGILAYLPAEAEASLFAGVEDLTAPGSRFLIDHFGPEFASWRHDAAVARWVAPFDVDPAALGDGAVRPPPAERLADGRWAVRTERAVDVARGWGRDLAPTATGLSLDNHWLIATRA